MSVCVLVCAQGKEHTVCVFVSWGGEEGVSQPAWAYFVSSPHSLPSTSPLILFPHPSLRYSLIPSSFLSTLPP